MIVLLTSISLNQFSLYFVKNSLLIWSWVWIVPACSYNIHVGVGDQAGMANNETGRQDDGLEMLGLFLLE